MISEYGIKLSSKWTAGCASLVLAGLLSSGVSAAPAPYAETIIINGKVITADSDDIKKVTIAEAIAISGDKIMAVGSNAEIQKLKADWTEVIDAKGNTVTPGYIDTHNHIYETSTGFPWVVKSIPDLLEIAVNGKTPEELSQKIVAAVEARAKQLPAGKWIRLTVGPPKVSVPMMNTNLLNRSIVDKVAPNNPVLITTRGGSILGGAAIKAIEAYYGNEIPPDYWMDKKDGPGRGWSGDYTDFGRCTSLDLIGTQDQDTFNKYIKGYFEVMQSNAQIGVTTYSSHIQCEGGFSATNHMDRNDLMPIRMAWNHRWLQPFSDSISESYRRIGDWVGSGSDWFFSTGSSVGGIDAGGVGWCTSMVAKSAEIKMREQCPPAPEGIELNAWKNRPADDPSIAANRGRRTEHLVTLAKLASEGRMTNIPGWHSAGDGATEIMMKTYLHYMKPERIKQLRTQSDHCHSVTPEEIEIASKTGHTFSCDATEVPTQVIKEGYGEEYLTWNAPVASMMKAGVNTVISEFGIQGYMRTSAFEDGVKWLTRKINGETWGVPEEAVPDKMTLMLMMTRWGAYPIWKDHALGSIEKGKLADIVILNGDYMATPVEGLDKLQSLMTFIGGKISFEDPALRGNSMRFNQTDASWTFDMKTPTTDWRWTKAPVVPPFLSSANGY